MRERGVREDLLREAAEYSFNAVISANGYAKAPIQRSLHAHRLRCEHQPFCRCDTDSAWQALAHAPNRRQRPLGVGVSELRRLCRQDEIRRKRNFKSARIAMSMHARDHGFRQLLQHAQRFRVPAWRRHFLAFRNITQIMPG